MLKTAFILAASAALARSRDATFVLSGILADQILAHDWHRGLIDVAGWSVMNPLVTGEPFWHLLRHTVGSSFDGTGSPGPRAYLRYLRGLRSGDPTVALPSRDAIAHPVGFTAEAAEQVTTRFAWSTATGCSGGNPALAAQYFEQSYQAYPRASNELPPQPREIKPHPYGIELGMLLKMLHDTASHSLAGFLVADFSRVSPPLAEEIVNYALQRIRMDPPPLDVPPEQQRWRLFNAYRDFVVRSCQMSPFVVVLEDLHWSDQSTLDLIDHLVGRPTRPSVVATMRTEGPLVVGVDTSTQSTKALVVDAATGRVVASGQAPHTAMTRPTP